jgi:cell division protein FtsL
MDDNTKDKDLVINSDGTIDSNDQGTTIAVSVKSSESNQSAQATPSVDKSSVEDSEPEVNDTNPPPQTEPIVEPPEPDSSTPSEVIKDATSGADPEPVTVKEAPETIQADSLSSEGIEPTTNVAIDQKSEETSAPTSPVSSDKQKDSRNSQDSSNQKPHEHRNNKKIAALVTVFVAFVLAGAAVYVFMSAESNTKQSETTTKDQTMTEETTVPTIEEDLQQAEQQIDEAINSIDEADLNEETVSDENLGIN